MFPMTVEWINGELLLTSTAIGGLSLTNEKLRVGVIGCVRNLKAKILSEFR